MPTGPIDLITNHRAPLPDLVRAFALVGICLVNAGGFAWPLSVQYYDGGLATAADRSAYFAVSSLFLMKSYPLFSMMFGAGLAYQLAAADRANAPFAPRYFRRMTALIGLGILHFVLFWMGDILLTYGILGCILFATRGAMPKTLVAIGIGLLLINSLLLAALGGLIWLGETYAPEVIADTGYDQMAAAEYAALRDGSLLAAIIYRLGMLPIVFPSVLLQQGMAVFAFFCLGLAIVKAGLIDRLEAATWQRARRVMLPLGLLGSGLGAWFLLLAETTLDSRFYFGLSILMVFSAPAAFGYIGLLAKLAVRAGPVTRFLAQAGSASLSAYIFQSLAFSFIFFGHGFALFGQLGAAAVTACALCVAIASLCFVGVWRNFAARGPLEVLLRRFTYLGKV